MLLQPLKDSAGRIICDSRGKPICVPCPGDAGSGAGSGGEGEGSEAAGGSPIIAVPCCPGILLPEILHVSLIGFLPSDHYAGPASAPVRYTGPSIWFLPIGNRFDAAGNPLGNPPVAFPGG